MDKVVVFDVIETLLDLSPLDTHFHRLFGDKSARLIWFGQMLQIAMTMTITGVYEDFGKAADAALSMTAVQAGIEIAAEDRKAILGEIRRLPPHPDVRPALEALRKRGTRVAALTNSTSQVAKAQLESARLSDLFEKILSVEAVKRYKPAREPYEYAARELGIGTGELLMIAAHAWDCAGAMAAGCQAAFVQRPGKSLNPLAKRPGIVVSDLNELIQKLQ
ncbi:MAG TPA: haloacid dehalogenase type II [Gemmatimonadaceae bacterium]